eukprot:TRINITY_DN81268_c0_g1_i1.p1 TRINITY_DN81268_c0_g1~~TRINITY_DN81268_c0_g1_i1.p1  ORF type:complete len:468 (-),score=90.70 TRINITY_DN81268_c0_g1_i1:373-1776(-)
MGLLSVSSPGGAAWCGPSVTATAGHLSPECRPYGAASGAASILDGRPQGISSISVTPAAVAFVAAGAAVVAASRTSKQRQRGLRSQPRAVAVGAASVAVDEGEGRATPGPSDLILRVAKGDTAVDRTPVWLMRQAGRYMKAFRRYSEKYPFRQRSETPEFATELSLQCWRRFGLDGVIFFSDILTPLPALGIEFDVVRGRGPIVLGDLARMLKDRLTGPNAIREIATPEDFAGSHGFIREILRSLRSETDGKCSLLGFVGAPWTLAAYAVEGGSTKDASAFKRWMFEEPEVVDEFLKRMTTTIANYAIFQVQSGAQVVQLFDSWGQFLSPDQWKRFAAPHVRRVAETVRAACPGVPLIYFAHGGSGYLQDQVDALADVVDVMGIDHRIRLAEAKKIVDGSGMVLQGNADPFILRYGSEAQVREAARRCIDEAGGPGRHILNLGHGVMQGTPEGHVAAFVEEAQNYRG